MSKELGVDTEIQPLLYEDDPDTGEVEFSSEIGRPRSRRRLWFIITAIVLVILLIGGALLSWFLTRTPAVQYTQSQVQTGNISVKISATGPVNPNAQYNLNFATSGQISEIDVQAGQQVKQGQTLAKLTVDTTTLQDNINAAQLGVTSAQDALNQAETSVANAQTSYNNTVAQNSDALKVAQDTESASETACSAATGTGPSATTPTAAQITTCQQKVQDQFAQTQDQLNSGNTSALNQITSSQNQVVSAQDSLDKANQQLQTAQQALSTANGSTVLTAPANATVASVNGSVGQTVGSSGGSSSSSSSSGTGSSSSTSSSSSSGTFIVLTDTGKLSVAAAVNEVDIGNVQVGQPAQFTVAAYPNDTFRASVSAINTIGVTSSSIVTYSVQLAVDMASLQTAHLYPGMTATVSITTQQRIGALLIPAAALTYPSIALQDGEINRSALFGAGTTATTGTTGSSSTGTTGTAHTVLELKNGTLTPVSITTGLSNGTSVEVLSGLQANDQVVIGQTGGNTASSTTTGGRTGTGTGGFGGGTGGFGGGGGGTGGGGRGGQ